MGGIATRRDDPARSHGGLLSCHTSHLDIDTIVLPILIGALQHCFGFWCECFDLLLEGIDVALGEAQASFKDDCFVAAKRVVEIKCVVSKFTRINNDTANNLTKCHELLPTRSDQARDSSNALASCKSLVSNHSVNQL